MDPHRSSPGSPRSPAARRLSGPRKQVSPDLRQGQLPASLVVLDNVDLTLHAGEIVGPARPLRLAASPPCCAPSLA